MGSSAYVHGARFPGSDFASHSADMAARRRPGGETGAPNQSSLGVVVSQHEALDPENPIPLN